MTDRELLVDVQTKLDALTPRVEALEAAASGAVSHDEVQKVVDSEVDLVSRVHALEKLFGTVPVVPVVPAPDGGEVSTPDPLTLVSAQPQETENTNHVIS